MNFLIAPDKFKESLTATAAAAAMARGAKLALPGCHTECCPVSDGGEGLVQALVQATGGTLCVSRVTGPLGEPVEATWGVLGDGKTAVIEMAQAAGLALMPKDRRDPRITTTFGVGELIRCALDAGLTHILLGIGGSATNDGGTGMAQALGVNFPGTTGRMTGGRLQAIRSVDRSSIDPRIAAARFTVACDVTNPLTGPQGASAIYGPQKGATPRIACELDAGLVYFSNLLPGSNPDLPGAGAAGGLGFGALVFLNATLKSGAELVLDAVDFDRRVRLADGVLTGEGRLDGQSLSGKLCVTVAARAQAAGKPVIAYVGCLEHAPEMRDLFRGCHAILDLGVTTDQAMNQAAPLLEKLVAQTLASYFHCRA